MALAAACTWSAACTQYPYHVLSASADAVRFNDPNLLRLPTTQRIRVAEALSVCDAVWEQIYSIKNAQAIGAQRWRSASLLVTALGTAAIAGGLLANDRQVKVNSATGQIDVSDPTAARWATGLGLLTVGIGATGAFALSLGSSEVELDTLQALLPQIQGARTALRAALTAEDNGVVNRQIAELAETCDGARQRVAAYNRDEHLSAQFGTEAVKALDREIVRRVDEADRKRTGSVMDTVPAGQRFEALARALGFKGARILGQPWQVGAGGERRHAIPLTALEPDLRKLAAADSAGQLAIAVFSPDERSPPAFGVSAALVGGDALVGSDAFLGRAVKSLVAPALDFEQGGGSLSVVGTVLSLTPYTHSLPADLAAWVCRIRPAPLVAPVAGPGTIAVAGCPPLAATASAPTTAGLRQALHLPPLPARGQPDDRLLVRMDGLGATSPGAALAAIVWLEGKVAVGGEGD
jgi:hypothetical protein